MRLTGRNEKIRGEPDERLGQTVHSGGHHRSSRCKGFKYDEPKSLEGDRRNNGDVSRLVVTNELFVIDPSDEADGILESELGATCFERVALRSSANDAQHDGLACGSDDLRPGLKKYIESHAGDKPSHRERDESVIWKSESRPSLQSVAGDENLRVNPRGNDVDVPRAYAVTLNKHASERPREDDQRIGPSVNQSLQASLRGARQAAFPHQATFVRPGALKVHDERSTTQRANEHWKGHQCEVDINHIGIGVPLNARGDGSKPIRERCRGRSQDFNMVVVESSPRLTRDKPNHRSAELTKCSDELTEVAIQPSVPRCAGLEPDREDTWGRPNLIRSGSGHAGIAGHIPVWPVSPPLARHLGAVPARSLW